MNQDKSQNPEDQQQPQPSRQDMVRSNGSSNDAHGHNTDPKASRFWRGWATVERLQAVFNFLLVIVTAMQATVSYWQWGLTQDSLLLTQRAVEIAALQAKAAQDANELTRANSKSSDEMAQQTLIANQRAWLGPNDAKLAEAPVAGKKLDVVITYHNTGKEPARNVAWDVERIVTTPEEEANGTLGVKITAFLAKCLLLKEREAGQVVYPSTGFGHATLRTIYPAEIIDEHIVNGKKWLVIQGCFVYRTFDKVRHSGFCFFYKGDMTKPEHLNVCLGGNYAD
jgi:hypothetical protein